MALYSIPLKLTELQQIPLRSFAATASQDVEGQYPGENSGRKILLLHLFGRDHLPVCGGQPVYLFFFADVFVWVLAGKKYRYRPVTGFNVVNIVRVFSIYGLLLPIDRMTGIGLDAINKPNINALKVLFMVVANIVGDLVAVFLFQSLLLVAVAPFSVSPW